MPKNNLTIPEDVAIGFSQYMPDTHIHTLGHDVVRADLQALENQIEADASTERIAWMNQIVAEKFAPHEVTAKERFLGVLGLRGDIMTQTEAGLVTSIKMQDIGNPERLKPLIDEDVAYVDEALDQARAALFWLDGRQDPKRVQALVWMRDSLSPHQRALYKQEQEDDPSISLFKWLAEKKADAMPENTEEERQAKVLQEAEDKHRLLNFLQSHNAYLAQRQQSPEFVEAVNEQKKLFSQGVRTGIREGWLHESAKDSLARVGTFDVYLGDYFTTSFSHRGGYYMMGDTNQVSIAEGAEEHATVHELNHALLETFPDPSNNKQPFAHEWLVESVTEELAQTFKGAKFGDFNTARGSYAEYRDLLLTVLDIADQLKTGVTFSDFTRAYSAPEEEQDQIVQQIAQTFYDKGYPNFNIFADIKDMLNARLDEIQANPEYGRLTKQKQRALAAKQAAGNLRSVARSLTDIEASSVVTS
jgi:hypothetical protein